MLESSPIINPSRRDWGSTPSSARESRTSAFLTPQLNPRRSPSSHSREPEQFSYGPPSPTASSMYLPNLDIPELGDTQSLAQSLYADRRIIPLPNRDRQNSAQAPEVYEPEPQPQPSPMSRYSPESVSASRFIGFRNSDQRFSDPFSSTSSMLPPPAVDNMQPDLHSLYTIDQEDPIAMEIQETIDALTIRDERHRTTSSNDQESFKRYLFKDAAILCEV